MRDPDTAFRRKMSEYGLSPGPIIWDRRLHHFPGKGKAEKNPRNKQAWYFTFDDRTGGQFGDFSQALPDKGLNWQMKRDKPPPTKAEMEEWARKDREAAKRQAKARARATKEVPAAWKAAVPANTANVHPYLEAKHIDRGVSKIRVLKKGTEGLKIMGMDFTVTQDLLLIPMKRKRKLVNVQRIFGGSKRYWPGAEVVGAFCAVGGELWKKNKPIYLCEGWATAWSIVECAKTVCIVAFSTGGLLPVAKRIRKKWGKARLIIAADNDRWTSLLDDDTPNARRTLREWRRRRGSRGRRYAIPDGFKDLTGSSRLTSTTYTAWRGRPPCKRWLNPNVARPRASPSLSPDRSRTRNSPSTKRNGRPNHRSGCLGVLNGIYHYFPVAFGEIVKMSAGQHDNRMQLCQLAPMAWWVEEFSDDRRMRWAPGRRSTD